MLSIFINNKEFTMLKRVSVLEACREVGIEIPRYCYHEGLSIAGNCRMCVVELKNSPKPLISCATPIINGMVIYTESPLVKKARESTLEFLLLNHPLDCPICDQGGECDLQDQSLVFGSDKKRFYSLKRTVKDKNLGPIIKTVMTRCIHCTRCVRFASEISGVDTLGTFNRGMSTEIGTYIEKSINSELSGNIVDLCPVGALTAKPYPFVSRSWELKTLKTIDFFDGFNNNIDVVVKNNMIVKILPTFDNENNTSWITDKVRFSFDGLFSELYLPKSVTQIPQNSNIFWETLFKDITHSIYFFEHLNSHNFKPTQITLLIDSNTSIELLCALHTLTKKYSFIVLRTTEQINMNADLESNFLTDTNLNKKIKDSNLSILVGLNSRYESPSLNILLRKRYKKGSFKLVSLGSSVDYTFPVEHIGLNTLNAQTITEGTHGFCQLIKTADNPVMFLGTEFSKRSDAEGVKLLLETLKNYSSIESLNCNVVSSGVNEAGLNYLKLCSPFTKSDYIKSDGLYCVDTSLDNPHISKYIDSFLIQNKINQNFKLIIKQNNSASLTLGEKNLSNTIYQLPSTNFFESSNTYINTKGDINKSFKILKPGKQSKTSWQIVRGFSHYLSTLTNVQTEKKGLKPLGLFDSFSLKQFVGSFFLPNSNLDNLSTYFSNNRKSCNINFSMYPLSAKKVYNTKLMFLMDDFYLGGKDNISKFSKVMVKCSKLLRADTLNFKGLNSY